LAKLVVRQGGQTREVPLTKDSVSIGRTPENDIELKDSLISRRHTTIVRRGDRYVVQDLGSSNGTYVNRERVETRVLDHGDVIRLGDAEITFLEEEHGRSSTARPAPRREATEFFGGPEIVQRVDDIAQNYSIDIAGALSQGLSLKDIRRDVSGERAARDSKMFFILFQVGKALSTAATLDDMLATAMRLIFEVIQAERGVILLCSGPQGELKARLAFHRARGLIDGRDIHVSTTITSQVVGQKVSIITSDALQDPRFMQGLSIVQYNIRSALCVPLWEEREVYGALYVDNLAKSYAFTKEDLELLTAIANLIAIRIRQEETQLRLRREELLRTNLSKYHSPDVVAMLMSRGGEVGLEVVEREVSVAFIDVEASTRLAETIGPKGIADLLNEFFLMATRAVFAHKGNVNKFIGDEVMAIFNAPVDLPNHAAAAVRCCLTMLDELERFNRGNPGRRFNVRCAVNTGPVVAGNVGTPTRMEYTVLGDTVNVAARLSKLPPVNSVVVGERTHELVKDDFPARDLGEVVLKGREKPLRAFEILREAPRPAGAETL
jgi:adenylate cyclase